MASHKNGVWGEAGKLRCVRSQASGVARSPAVFDVDIRAFIPTERCERLREH